MEHAPHGFLLAYAAYLIATLSPGPANLAIIAAAMRSGRRAGLSLAAGVILGSATWGLLAALGLSAALRSYAGLAEALRIIGGLYLLWLAYKSFRAAASGAAALPAERGSGRRFFARGLAIHLTNPKAILAWLAVIAIGVGPGAPAWTPFAIVGGCFVMGIGVFGGYALAFSTQSMVRAYARLRVWIEGASAAVFGLAGAKLLLGSR